MAGRKNSLLIAVALFLFPECFGQEGGESVVVVYNSSSPASKQVAEHYVARRQVPAKQVFAYALPETESISREDFENKLQRPLWNELKARKLFVYRDSEQSTQECNVAEAKIRYAVLCYGVPVKISPDLTRKESMAESMRAELRRNEASVDSELALLPVLDRKLAITGLTGNPTFGATNSSSLHPTNGILMVARLDGPTPRLAMGLVDKALQAERDGLWGRAYFDLRGLTDGPHRPGDDWIQGASQAAKAYGFEMLIDKSPATFPPQTPLSDVALYFGWYDQSVSGPFTNGMVQFRPGAVAYHLHSFSARTLRVNDVWWAGPLIALGATATMGCTEEPYLQGTPHPNVFLSRFLLLGFSFGEAAYAAQGGLSWQVTIIGDPLYRPFAKSHQARFQELETKKSKDIEWSLLHWINLRLAEGGPLTEIEKFYAQNTECKHSAVLQEKLAEIYRLRGKLFDAIEPYENALKLPMEPLQKLRVSLNAASLFSTLSKNEETYEILKAVLRDFPDYPNKRDVYERLQKVASRLERTEEAAEFERLSKQGSGG